MSPSTDAEVSGTRRTMPAGRALVVILAALVVGSLLNAERIHVTAGAQPLGWQRTWAMRVTGPLQAVSRATRLDVPREVLARATGAPELIQPEDTRTVVTAPPVAPVAPEATTTTVPPVEVRAPSVAEPLRVHMAGDSLIIPIGPAILERFDGQPVEITEGYQAATGLARPDVLNWPARLATDLAALDPDVVVVGFGGNDAQPMVTADGNVAPGTDEWAAEYQRRVAQVLDAIEREGRTLYWMGLPVTTADNIEAAAPAMAAAVLAEVAVRPWAHYVDTNEVLSPGGSYAAYLPDGSGGQVKMRQDDGVHLTTAGATRVVEPLAELLADERSLD